MFRTFLSLFRRHPPTTPTTPPPPPPAAPPARPTGTCPITFEPLTCDNSIVTPCGHAFTRDGLQSWVRVNNTCPLCRTRLDSLQFTTDTVGRNTERTEHTDIFRLLLDDVIGEQREQTERTDIVHVLLDYVISEQRDIERMLLDGARREQQNNQILFAPQTYTVRTILIDSERPVVNISGPSSTFLHRVV